MSKYISKQQVLESGLVDTGNPSSEMELVPTRTFLQSSPHLWCNVRHQQLFVSHYELSEKCTNPTPSLRLKDHLFLGPSN